jgi:Tfp pilus assembly protein PilV
MTKFNSLWPRGKIRAINVCERGFSLLEALIALILLSIGFQVFLGLNALGRRIVKESQTDSRLMDVALFKMEDSLMRSFADLNNNSSGMLNDTFWQVNITEQLEGSIPYKLVDVTAANSQADGPAKREVKLENIVPYPFLHSYSKILPGDNNAAVPFIIPPPLNPTQYALVRTNTDELAIEVDFRVSKNLMIIYNISIDQEDVNGLGVADTIITACLVDGVFYPVETETPIITQPLISNAPGVKRLPAERLN